MNTNPQNTAPQDAQDAQDAMFDDPALGETVAKLAAASPYMAPPADLRGKILQATAPGGEKIFRMEDYRKANRDTGRFFRWGFAAAILFLFAGAYCNLKTQLKATVAAANVQLNERNLAISNLVNPKVKPVDLQQDGKTFARAYVNESTKSAVVLVADGLIPAGKTINQITLTGEDGKPVAYRTIAITTSRDAFPQVAASDKLNGDVQAHNVQPDPTQKVYTAQMH